ncbi:LytR/AlgR family response regulator transcription factor [Romboutsia lituseburensis]|uniref:LytR/AlgR family response regulator transcription factor n=1 Tax=Romboutsia lituseburensis TaxID=1537 RepID=UPI00215B67D4|nr:LytTR family DNA-binding domain-containing protein [Romboutsia lituseburensis]MCR8745369.1 LytTR family DNA-binding domain-containing protein [Romboutsia lituseburensis]
MKCIIVEDEFPAREELKYFINNFSNIKIINEFDNGVDVLKFIQENMIDVIFLDINIPMLDGMLLAKTIKQFKISPKIVFITAYKEHAVDAFELEAFDYVLKPYSEERIVSMLKKLESSEKSKTIEKKKNDKGLLDESSLDKVSLWKNDKLIVVKINDIYYCEANERETIVFTKEDKYIVKSSITEFEKNLPSSKFFKTHRSYIVNTSKIKEIIPWFNNTYKLKLKDINSEAPVSRSKIKEFRKVMHI